MSQFAHSWLGLIVDISIKSLGLAVLAGLALFALRVRDTNLRHRVWTAVLFGMLAMPALVFVTPAIPLPRWMNIAIPDATAEARPVGDNADGRLIATPPRRTTDAASDAISVAASESDAIPEPMMSGQSPPAPDALRPAVANDLPTKDPVPAGAPVAGRPSVAVQMARRLPVVLASLYFAVAAIFAARLITGLWLTYRLIRQARQMNLPAISASPRRSLRFLESELIHVPATVGFLRPVVLLPMSWRQWSEAKLRAALAHELAHVRRADWLVITLAELNRAIYWFHPLAWFLRRRLSELAELNCDDAVLEADGDRTQYARHLLEVASSLAAAGARYRPPLSGVAMARKPNVETRIDAILDAGRPLARRLGALGAIVLLVTGATAVLLTAALRTAADDGAKKPAAEMEMNGPAKNEGRTAGAGHGAPAPVGPGPPAGRSRPARERAQVSRPAGKAPESSVEVHGHVLDADGAPVANARVVATQSRWLDSQYLRTEQRQSAETFSGVDGSFAIAVPRVEQSDFRNNSLSSYAWSQPTLIAKTADQLSSWVGGGETPVKSEDPLKGDVVLRLRKPSKIRGHLVSLEGQPLPGLSVAVKELAIAEPENLDPWLETVKRLRREGKLPRPGAITGGAFSIAMVADSPTSKQIRDLQNNSPYFPIKSRLLPEHPQFPPAVRSDADGRFDIDGLPADSLAILEISGPGVMTHTISVVNRDIERIDVPQTGFPGVECDGYYGLKLDHPVAPGTDIVGTVTDRESGRPLAGIRVASHVIVDQMLQRQWKWTCETDTKGGFKIEGLPIGGKKWLDVSPGAEQPYLESHDVEVPNSTNANPTKIEIKLRRGALVRGKVTDAETGEPVDATVHYHPFLSNEHATDYGYDSQRIRYEIAENRQRTDEKGMFHAVVIPGQGILAVRSVRRGEYCLGLGMEKLEVTADGRFATFNFASPQFYNRVEVIDVPANVAVVDHDLTVSHGVKVTLNVQDREGQPLRGVLASGLTPFSGPGNEEAATSSLELTALRPGETRRVLLLHKPRRLGQIVDVSAPEKGVLGAPRNVALDLCGVVTGRVVNGDGELVAGLQFEARTSSTRNSGIVVPQRVITNADGKFRFEYLPPGAIYRRNKLLTHADDNVRLIIARDFHV